MSRLAMMKTNRTLPPTIKAEPKPKIQGTSIFTVEAAMPLVEAPTVTFHPGNTESKRRKALTVEDLATLDSTVLYELAKQQLQTRERTRRKAFSRYKDSQDVRSAERKLNKHLKVFRKMGKKVEELRAEFSKANEAFTTKTKKTYVSKIKEEDDDSSVETEEEEEDNNSDMEELIKDLED